MDIILTTSEEALDTNNNLNNGYNGSGYNNLNGSGYNGSGSGLNSSGYTNLNGIAAVRTSLGKVRKHIMLAAFRIVTLFTLT